MYAVKTHNTFCPNYKTIKYECLQFANQSRPIIKKITSEPVCVQFAIVQPIFGSDAWLKGIYA